MMRKLLAALGLLLFAVSLSPSVKAAGADEPEKKDLSREEVAAIATKIAPSLVRVEYTPRYDNGESPSADRWSSWRQRSSDDDSDADSYSGQDWERLILEERPAERGGYLIAPDLVLTSEPGLHPRFLKSIQVRFGDDVVDAKVGGWLLDRSGVFLKLDRPLKGAEVFHFEPGAAGPYLSMAYSKREGAWVTRSGSPRSTVEVTSEGRKISPQGGLQVVLDKKGTPITIIGGVDMAVGDAWKSVPSTWGVMSSEESEKALRAVEQNAEKQLLRVTLNFRSPPSDQGQHNRRRYFDESEQNETEWNGIGVLMDDRTVLVLAGLKPKMMGRLEKIRVFLSDGKEVAATFVGTLKDWNAFIVKLPESVGGGVMAEKGSITDIRSRLLVKAEIAVKGETRKAFFSNDRVHGFYTGYKGNIFPMMDASTRQSGGRGYRGNGGLSYDVFLYGTDGGLIALPLGRRDRLDSRESMDDNSAQMTPLDFVKRVMSEGEKAYDPENRPLTAEEENRLAWLGVEMQGMDPDLARANNVVELTNGGTSGGLVTYVYENSPASKAGIQVGDILLRLNVEGQPRPLEVNIEESGAGGFSEQFWQFLDRVPEEYFDRMGKPWGSAETPLTRALTDVGFGTKFTVEAVRDGKKMQFPMTVTQGPAHFDAAAKFKSEDLGVTVRDITYEVRRYLQMKPDEKGVIVSKVEKGGRTSVAGLKPMETIRSVNDKPVANVKEFEEAVKGGGELKFAVKRMTQGRTVMVKGDEKKADAPKSGEPK